MTLKDNILTFFNSKKTISKKGACEINRNTPRKRSSRTAPSKVTGRDYYECMEAKVKNFANTRIIYYYNILCKCYGFHAQYSFFYQRSSPRRTAKMIRHDQYIQPTG